MAWNYRVVRQDDTYTIHEVYYDQEGRITAFSTNPVAPCGETLEELRVDMDRQRRALDEPVLDYAVLNLMNGTPG